MKIERTGVIVDLLSRKRHWHRTIRFVVILLFDNRMPVMIEVKFSIFLTRDVRNVLVSHLATDQIHCILHPIRMSFVSSLATVVLLFLYMNQNKYVWIVNKTILCVRCTGHGYSKNNKNWFYILFMVMLMLSLLMWLELQFHSAP